MFNDKILKSVAEAVKSVVDEALKGDQHKIDKNKNGKVDAHDFKLLRKEEAKKPASPFDWKNTPRQTAEKGEKTGHTAKKISTGTVYTKKYTKEEASQAEFNAEIKKAQDKSTGKVKAEVAKPAVQAVQNEQVEQLDELSKKTLGSYVKKASHDVAHKGALTRQFANDSAAAKKDSNYWDAKKADDKSNKMFAKSWKRRENMGKAVDRLAKEEYEQLDELSKSTLKSYKKKATSQVMTAFNRDPSDYYTQKMADKMDRRADHIGTAAEKLDKIKKKKMKEEVEELNELSKKTLNSYSDAAHKDFSKNFQNDQHFTGVHAALRKAMAKTNSATGGVHSLKGRNKNPLRKHDAVQAGLKTAADAVTAARAPFQHKMKVRNQGMDRADARLNKEEVEHIEERSLSTGEKAAMEKNVKGMKKNIAGFKERYGKDAKSVMYATATKQAKGE
jgi:hypothetical protein